ncbi:MAG TPA: hypothetical protein VMN04_06945 [Thermoanaerobaculia bacterium]|nr:hypothetical protein [Thermoanaerobaculia bacterium]
MKKTILAAALALGSALGASASDQPNKSASQTTGAAQQSQIGIQTPFKVWPSDDWIFVVNYGNADWTGPLDVWATCVPVAPTTSCGPNFVGGKYHAAHYDKGTFPKGHGNAPVKGSANAQQTSGPGWVAVFMGLPAGSYTITATAANNASPATPITIAAPQGGNTVHVSPGAIQLAPTRTPTPSPRRP